MSSAGAEKLEQPHRVSLQPNEVRAALGSIQTTVAVTLIRPPLISYLLAGAKLAEPLQVALVTSILSLEKQTSFPPATFICNTLPSDSSDT